MRGCLALPTAVLAFLCAVAGLFAVVSGAIKFLSGSSQGSMVFLGHCFVRCCISTRVCS